MIKRQGDQFERLRSTMELMHMETSKKKMPAVASRFPIRADAELPEIREVCLALKDHLE